MEFFEFILSQATIYLFVLFTLIEELNPHCQHIPFRDRGCGNQA